MIRTLLIAFAVLAAALLTSGCGGSGGSTTTTTNGNGASGANPAPAEPVLPELTGEVKLEPADWDAVQKAVQSHKGKVVVLDLWSNWCEPCMRELPGLVKLQRQYKDDVVCMTLNLNYDGIEPEPTDEQKTVALDFLKQRI